MSRKNHKMIDGRLLQTNKKYSQLKMKQKEKIAEWMFQATRDYYMKKCTFPSDKHLEEVVDSVYEKIEDAEIWIPYGEVFKHYKSKRSDINKRVRKSLNEKEESRIEKVCFMNMCMIQDHKGNVLALDKVNDSYTGTTFPGGHGKSGKKQDLRLKHRSLEDYIIGIRAECTMLLPCIKRISLPEN